MKKKVITLVIVAIVSEIVALSAVFVILSIFNNKNNMVNAAVSDIDTDKNVPAYASIYGDKLPYYLNSRENEINTKYNSIEADIVLEADKVLINETLHLMHSDGHNQSGNKQDVIFLYIPSLNTSTTNIKKIMQGEKTPDFKVENLMLKIELPNIGTDNNSMIESNSSVNKTNNSVTEKNNSTDLLTIEIEYEILLNKSSGTISRTNSHTYLTNFLITPAVFRDNEPIVATKSSFGDPYIYNASNYTIRFLVDNDVDIYAPGAKEESSVNEGKKYIRFEAKMVRDFPAVILKNNPSQGYTHVVEVEKVKDTEIYFINSNKTRNFVKEAFTFAYENIGPYPYEKLFIVEGIDMDLRGMEFSNMIFISKSCLTNANILKRVTYHEVFHQWFYGIIGTDQITEPFFDEGLVSYLAMYLVGDKIGNNYNSGFLNKRLKDYGSVNEYYDLAYDNATYFFASIHKKLGDSFYEMLKKIYDDKKYTILYYNEFMDYVNMFTQGGK